MTGPMKSDDEDLKPEEIAALAKGLRRSALRASDPDIVATSNGREAASYHAAAAPPPAATSKTIPTGGVRLSATLERDIANLGRGPGKAGPGSAASLGVTVAAVNRVPGRPSRAGASEGARIAAWLVGAIVVAALLGVAFVALRAPRTSASAAPGVSGAATIVLPAPATAARSPAAPPAVPSMAASPGPSPADPTPADPTPAVTAPGPSAPVSARRPTSRSSPSAGAAAPSPHGSGGSGEMITPPL